MSTKNRGIPCYDKASDDEPLFVLRGQDKSSPRIVAEWIKENIETAPAVKLFEALQTALEMRERGLRKHAD